MELSLPLFRRAPRRTSRARRPAGLANGGLLARPLALLRADGRALRTLSCVLIALALLGGGWLWLRGSSFVAVRSVRIAGVHGIEESQIRAALEREAKRMTTLDFDAGALRSAVSQFTIVAAVHATTSFPHTVRIAVTERPPVAALSSAGQRTAVAADGVVLGPALLSSALPTITSPYAPLTGTRLSRPTTLAAVAALAAAPPELVRFVTRVYSGPQGLTVAMRNGLLVYFGDATRPHAKWLSLARVLVSPSAAGAIYVDVRLPERPAAGFSAPTAPASPSAASAAQPGSAEAASATLAHNLEAAVGGGTPTGAATTPEPSTATPGASETGETATSGANATETQAQSPDEATPPASETTTG
jgi:cell division protein FtsQ